MTKVDIFSGFLGAGKTTLIKKLIKEVYTGEKLVLIENEFGEIGIDGGFLQEAGINITEMNSGCICCSLVGDFGQALQKVIAEFAPDRILIEPSGVGKLSDVIKAVEDQHIEGLTLSSCVTVADAGKCKMYMKNFGEFFNNQIEHAGCIVLSRTGSIKEEKLSQAIELIRQHNEKAAIIAAPWDTISGDQILEAMEHRNTLEDELKAMEEEHHHHHEHEHHHHHSHEHHHGDVCHCHEHDHHHIHEHDHEHGTECHCHEHEDHEHECHEHEDHEHECHDHEHHHHECEGHAHHPGDKHCHEHHGEDHDMEHCCHHEHHEHHHHHHDEECCCHHEHHEHHHHHHDEECCCGHDHHEHHHHHGESCSCGHDHHADEVFTSWGKETAKKFTAEEISSILDELDSGKFGTVLRAKGIVSAEGQWIHFDFVPGEKDVRFGSAAVIGRLCVIGADIDEKGLEELFGI